MIYNKENRLRVMTLCSGYDSQCLALERLKRDFPCFDYELAAWAEFDPESKTPLERQPAVIAHNALFPQWKDRNWGDMTKIDWEKVPDIDLLFYSTPCQSISAAGLQHGFAEGSGTRSSIIWNVRDAVIAKRPKYLCLENVKAMVSGKFVGMFNLWQRELERLGYVNFARVLNAKDYGVPQNRERIFLVSIRMDDLEGIAGNVRYHFPKPFELKLRLKDVLEEKVDEKYYLSDDKIEEMFTNGLAVDGEAIYDTDKNRAQYELERYGETLFNEEAKTELCDNYQDEELPPDVKVEGRINSSQDGVVVSKEGIAPCHTAGHGNCPKIKE